MTYKHIRSSESDLVEQEVQQAISHVKSTWQQIGNQIRESTLSVIFGSKSVPTEIPGHPEVSPLDPKVGDFVALVMDIRDSFKHLTESHSPFVTDKERLFRAHIESAAACAAAICLIRCRTGRVTEILGDGVLALFGTEDDGVGPACKKAYYCGESIIEAVQEVVNPELHKLNIPRLSVGVGISVSQAIVTTVGDSKFYLGKAIGPCVYRATKLSGGNDVVVIDESVNRSFPTKSDGKLLFEKISAGDLEFSCFVDKMKTKGISRFFKLRAKKSR